MTAAEAIAGRRLAERGVTFGTVALLAAVGCATAAAAALSNGDPGLAIAPVGAITLLWAISKAPLRWSTSVLVLLVLSLDIEEDAQGQWHSPLSFLGDLLHYNVDKLYPSIPVKLSGLEILVLLLLAVAAWRRIARNPIDRVGQEQTAAVLVSAVTLYVMALAYSTANGLANDGQLKFAILQVRPLLHVAALFALFHFAYRGPRDHVLIGKLVVLAACIKAGLAVWADTAVRSTPWFWTHGRHWQCATNHGDSVLFSIACVTVIAQLLERMDRKRLRQAALFVPVFFVGMRFNHRRLAWVDLAVALICIYLVSPWAPWKRAVKRAILVGIPVAVLYVAIGWNAGGGLVFGPIRMVRSLSDSSVDRSTLYREIENWNLAMSIREAPVVGRGFGHPFSEFIKGDDISSIFELYALEPHNAVLGLVLFGGLIAFTAMWMPLAVGIFLAVRSHRFASAPEDRAAALTAMAALLIVSVQTFGDLGQYYVQFQVFTAFALVVAGKLATATGAWPRRVRPVFGLGLPSRPAGWR